MTKRAKWRVPAMLSAGAILAVSMAGCGGKSGGAGGAGGGAGGAGASGDATVATVNGQQVDREEMHRFLEATHGEEALRQLVEFELVMQELKKQGMSVSDEEVKDAIARRGQQNPAMTADIERISKSGGPMLEALQRNVRYQLAIDKLLTKDIKADEATLKSWYQKNRTRYGTPARVKLGILITSTRARADAMSQQLKSKTKTFAQLIEEQKKAKDPAAVQGSVAESAPLTVDDLPPTVKPQVAKLKPGQVSPVIALTTTPPQVFAVVRLNSREEAKSPTFEEIRDQVEREYKLEQVARGVVKENPQNPPFEKTLQQVELAVGQQSAQATGRASRPSYREVLSFINQTAVSRLTSQLHSQAKVQISDPMYERVAKEFQPAPAAATAPGASAAPGGAAPGGATSGNTAPGGTASGGAAPPGGAAPAGGANSATGAAPSTPTTPGTATTPRQ